MLAIRKVTRWPLESVLTFLSFPFSSSPPLNSFVTTCPQRFLLFFSLAGLSFIKCDVNISLPCSFIKASLWGCCVYLGWHYLLKAASKLWHVSKIQCIRAGSALCSDISLWFWCVKVGPRSLFLYQWHFHNTLNNEVLRTPKKKKKP